MRCAPLGLNVLAASLSRVQAMNTQHHGIIHSIARLGTTRRGGLMRDTSGAQAVEYVLLMALVGVLLIISVLAMSDSLGDVFEDVAVVLDDPTEFNTRF